MFEGKNYINGNWDKEIDGVMTRNPFGEQLDTYDNINPATGKPLGKFPISDAKTVEYAVGAAREAFHSWKRMSRFARSDYMNRVAQIIERRKEELARVISFETGKNYNESVAEVNEALHMAQFAFGSGRYSHGEAVSSEIADKDAYMLRKPKGVIAIITPFNFPLAIGMFWNAAPSIVEGNTVIIKPSEDAPMSTQMAVEIYEEAGIPHGVINLVHGLGDTGDALARANVDHICFTGSADVGQHIRKVAAESWHKTTSCELGSKSACVVFDDVELDLAVEAAIASAFKLSGQRCVSSGRIIVQRNVYDEFCRKFAEQASKLKTGNPFKADPSYAVVPDESVYYGPIINEQGFAKIRRMNSLVASDPKVEILLSPIYSGEHGSYYSTPMVYKREWTNCDSGFLRNEVFGPHVALIPFDTVEDAIHIYNDTEYGLAVGILTNDFRKARVMRDECDAGMIYWNGGSIAAESHLAFGGVKKSGNGFPSAARTYRAVTHEISWTVNHSDRLMFPQGMSK